MDELTKGSYDAMAHKIEQLIKANYLMQQRIVSLEEDNATLREQTMTDVLKIRAGGGFIVEDMLLKAGFVRKVVDEMPDSELKTYILQQLEDWRAEQHNGHPLYALNTTSGKLAGILTCKEFKNKSYIQLHGISCMPRFAGKDAETRLFWAMMDHWHNEGYKRIKMEVDRKSLKFYLNNGAIVWGFNGNTGDAFVDIPIRPTLDEQMSISNNPTSYINHDDPRWQLLPGRGALKTILEKSRRGMYSIPSKDLTDAIGNKYIRLDDTGVITEELSGDTSDNDS